MNCFITRNEIRTVSNRLDGVIRRGGTTNTEPGAPATGFIDSDESGFDSRTGRQLLSTCRRHRFNCCGNVGVYFSPEAPKKWTITRDGGTLFVQPGSESPAALEVTAQDKFQLFGGRVVFEFDAAKNQMILKRAGRSIVFTKEK